MRTPEPFWLVDNIDVKTWYYRDAPAPGSIVRYVNEDFIDTVARVTTIAIWFESGHMMRRPYLASRLAAWIVTASQRPKRARSSYSPAIYRLPALDAMAH